MLWDGSATGDKFVCHDLGAESIHLVRGKGEGRGRGKRRGGDRTGGDGWRRILGC